MRTARIQVARPLHDGETARVVQIANSGETRMKTKRLSARVRPDLEHLPRRHEDVRPPADVERIGVRHYRVERVVAASEVDDHEIPRLCALCASQVAQKRRRGESEGER